MDSICRYVALFTGYHSLRVGNDLHEINNSWSSTCPQKQHHSPNWRIMTNNNQNCGKYQLNILHGSINTIDVGSKRWYPCHHLDIHFLGTKLGNNLTGQSYFCQDDTCYHQIRTQNRYIYTMTTWGFVYWRIVLVLHEEWSIFYNLLRSRFGNWILYYSNISDCYSALLSQ